MHSVVPRRFIPRPRFGFPLEKNEEFSIRVVIRYKDTRARIEQEQTDGQTDRQIYIKCCEERLLLRYRRSHHHRRRDYSSRARRRRRRIRRRFRGGGVRRLRLRRRQTWGKTSSNRSSTSQISSPARHLSGLPNSPKISGETVTWT